MPPKQQLGEERREVGEEVTVTADRSSDKSKEESATEGGATECGIMLHNFMRIQQMREERMEQDVQLHEQRWRALQHQFSLLQEESNMVAIYAAVSGVTVDEVVCQSEGLDTAQYKQVVADAVIQTFSPIREEVERLRADLGYLKEVLSHRAEKAKERAIPVYRNVQRLIGFC
ncbi:Tryptophan--tRNA ligase, mitochondrial [Acipenser ruthenus]|uniref:Tryptophan--tRNA ligase, mitochondrial n=1 Tax=Acipenser ruthenus TaxID=7906 RepID=A0A444UFF5_ACIRT|nr:Tryptophan--tRNA ligase, mitochondrial [Acipenser ruthenus]